MGWGGGGQVEPNSSPDADTWRPSDLWLNHGTSQVPRVAGTTRPTLLGVVRLTRADAGDILLWRAGVGKGTRLAQVPTVHPGFRASDPSESPSNSARSFLSCLCYKW